MDFNETELAVAPDGRVGANPFAVCRLGILWRVILGVQLPLAVGALFGSRSPIDALTRWAEMAVVSVSATLLWLLVVCALAGPLAKLPSWGQFLFTTALGVCATAMGLLPSWWIAASLDESLLTGWAWVPPLAAGGVMAACATAMLRWRASEVVPSDAQARLAELQARIRPHFLFNTLNTAIALVQIDPQRAEAVLEDLAELFHEALVPPNAQSTLTQEIGLAKRYLAIESLRFGERLKVNWQWDATEQAAVNQTRLPPLVLQPLVENAVRHGIEPSAQGGWVRIEVRQQGGQAVITVSNSVPAASAERPPSTGQGMALRNVRQRLHLMYDIEADFDAGLQDSNAEAGTSEEQVFVARMTVPVARSQWG